MTIRLYDREPYLKDTEARITAVSAKSNNIIAIELDRTLFYPEGGGQPSDQGTMTYEGTTFDLQDVVNEDSRIWHMVRPTTSVEPSDNVETMAEILKPGQLVRLSLDWSLRFHHMQQHLGQHMLSAAFFKAYDAKTIGFHMGADYVTIDLDRKLTIEEVRAAETLANEHVTMNLPVVSHYPDDEGLKSLELRKVPKVSEDIRIVSIDGFDHTPCGGTHPKNTGEVGIISVRKSSNYKNGIRVEFICGQAALKELQRRTDLMNSVCSTLSVQENGLSGRIETLLGEIEGLKKSLREMADKNISFEVDRLLNSTEPTETFLSDMGIGDLPIAISEKLIACSFNNIEQSSIKSLSTRIGEKRPECIRLLMRTFDEGFTIVLDVPGASNDISAKQCLKTIQDNLGGKGGGSDRSAQATFPSDVQASQVIHDIIAFFCTTGDFSL